MWGDSDRAESSLPGRAKAHAARAAQIRTFEAVLYDHARFSYFLDFLSQHQQAHKLLFWFEVEQFKILAGNPGEMLARQQSLFDKYLSPESALRLPLPAPVAARAAALRRRGAPCGYLFCVAQAFAYQELRDVWYPKFRASPSRAALLEHLRMSFPLSLSQLLVEGPFRDCLALFLSRADECPPEVKADHDLWAAAHDTLRPLCASVLKTLEQRGAEGLANALGHLLEECGQFRERLLLSGTECVKAETRAAVAQRVGALRAHASLPAGAVRAAEVEAVRGAVGQLADVLLQAQQQAYRALEKELPTALRRSATFGAFVEDMQSMDCAPLQARLIILNHVADVLRKRPDRCQESSIAGRIAHLLKPAPSPPAPPPPPVAELFLLDTTAAAPARQQQLAAGAVSSLGVSSRGVSRGPAADDDGPPQLELAANMRRNKSLERDLSRRGAAAPPPPAAAAAAAAAAAKVPAVSSPPPPPAPRPPPRLSQSALDPLLCLSCPQLLFAFEVAVSETPDHLEVEKGLGEGAGLFAPSLAGLHACTAAPRETERARQNHAGTGASRQLRQGGTSAAAAAAAAGAAALAGGTAASALTVVRRFRTHVKQLRHVTVPRAVRPGIHVPFPGQAPCVAPAAGAAAAVAAAAEELPDAYGFALTDNVAATAGNGGGATTVNGVADCARGHVRGGSGSSGGGSSGGGSGAAYVGVGLLPGTPADMRTLNEKLLELMEAGLLEALPAYCLPGAMAAVAQAALVRMASAEGLASCRGLAPSMHHFVITLPRKRKAHGGGGGAGFSVSGGGAGGGGPSPGSSSGAASPADGDKGEAAGDAAAAAVLADRPSPRRRRPMPVPVDRANNIVLYGACITAWAEAPAPQRDPGLDVVFLPRCVTVLSADPLFDTLRAVALRLAPAAGLSLLPPPPPPPPLPAVSASLSPSAASEEQGATRPRRDLQGAAGGVAAPLSLTLLAPPASCPPRGWPLGGSGPPPHPDLPLSALFSALSVDNVLTALRALVLERPVVVTGSVRSALALSCEGLRSLLYPLRWHHPYVPLLPASELYPFWRAKMLDERGDRQSSPPPQQGVLGRAGGGGGGPSGESPAVSPVRRGPGQPPRPYLIGLDARLVQAAQGDFMDSAVLGPQMPTRAAGAAAAAAERPTSLGRGGGRPPLQPAWAWGVRTRESCLASALTDPAGRCSAATTTPGDAARECARRMLARAVLVDLDNDEVTLPLGGLELGVAPPPWPPEPLAAARRRAQLALFPEFFTFDTVTPAQPPQAPVAASSAAGNGALGGSSPPRSRPVSLTKQQQQRAGKNHNRAGGLREDEAARVRDALARAAPPPAAAAAAAAGAAGGPAPMRRQSSGGGAPEEAVERMYRPTTADRQLRAAMLGLMLGVLGRCKEFTTAFPEHGVVRFDTAAFLEAHGCGNWTDHGGAADFYRELLRTRAFAAMLSDEVAADLDLPRMQTLLLEAAASAATGAVTAATAAERSRDMGSGAS